MIVSGGFVMTGYKWMFDKKLLQIFSASSSNDGYGFGNVGGVAIVDKECKIDMITFERAPDDKRVPLIKDIPDYFI